jgi:hypothetical protein
VEIQNGIQYYFLRNKGVVSFTLMDIGSKQTLKKRKTDNLASMGDSKVDKINREERNEKKRVEK